MTDELVQEKGFENLKEFHKLVSNLDLSDASKLQAFRKWQLTDGTKKGLLAL